MRILVLDLHIASNPRTVLKIVNAVKSHSHTNPELVRFYSRDFKFRVLFDYKGIILSGLDKSRLLYSGKMQRLKSYIRHLESRTQLLGICGGHQVLATAYSYPIHEIMPEAGWHNVQLTKLGKHDPLFHDIEEFICPYHHHNKAVFQVSLGKILAENKRCIQAVLFHPNVRGVQFHPEYSFTSEPDLTRECDHYNQQVGEKSSDWNYNKKQFFRNFISLCESST